MESSFCLLVMYRVMSCNIVYLLPSSGKNMILLLNFIPFSNPKRIHLTCSTTDRSTFLYGNGRTDAGKKYTGKIRCTNRKMFAAREHRQIPARWMMRLEGNFFRHEIFPRASWDCEERSYLVERSASITPRTVQPREVSCFQITSAVTFALHARMVK